MGKQIEAEKETVADAALRLLLDELNPAHAEQVRRGIRTIEESTVDGAAVLRAICNALHYAAPTPDPAVELYDSVDWLAQGYPSAAAEIEDMANVGRALMERIAEATKPGAQLAGWSPADCPTEIVTDLLNMLHEAPTPDSTVEVGELVERATAAQKAAYDWAERREGSDGSGLMVRLADQIRVLLSALDRTREPQVDALREENARLREALKPFARLGELIEIETDGFADDDDLSLIVEDGHLLDRFPVRDFRRARAALGEKSNG